jgi:zinc protease
MKRYAWLLVCLLPLVSWAGIPIQHWTLPTGAKVYLVEAPGIPMVDVQIEFDAGARRDPEGQTGLAVATSRMMGKGIKAAQGQPAMDENQLGEAWADLGAMVSANASADRMAFSLRSLTRPELLDAAVALAARELAAPSFPSDVWQSERERWLASIAESNTKPATQAGKAFNQAVFGQHPYGAEIDEASLRRIDTAAMAQFLSRHLLLCQAKISVVGAVNRAQTERLLNQLLSGLPRQSACPAQPLVPEVMPLKAAKTLNIPFESAQAHVFIGQPGIPRQHPDFFALTLGNYVLGGGGFVSRLTDQVREKRGLSYSVYSYFSPGQHAGAFTVGLQTRPDQAAQAVQVATDVLAEFVRTGPTDQEVQAAKDFMIGGFALRLDSNRKLLDNLSNIAWFDLPLDYLDTWSAEIDKLSAAQIQQAFARNLQPERMVTVILGAKP